MLSTILLQYVFSHTTAEYGKGPGVVFGFKTSIEKLNITARIQVMVLQSKIGSNRITPPLNYAGSSRLL